MIDHNVLFNLERQMRLIAEHREKDAEKAIRTVCSAMMKEMQNLTANEYAKSADGDDRLTFDTLYRNGRYSRFLEEAEKTIDGFTPQIQSEIESLVKDSYKQMYDGMVDAVTKAATSEDLRRDLKVVRAVRPEVLKQAVMNPISGLTLPDRLEKHRRDIIYDIKQQIGVGLAVGDRYSTIARRIADSCNMSYQKAVRIARTESHRVREAAANDSAIEVDTAIQNGTSGLIGVKTWETMEDERVRPQQRRKTKHGWKTYYSKNGANHMVMQGKMVKTADAFDLGGGVKAQAPGQSGVAGHDINCRCFIKRDWLTAEEYAKAVNQGLTSNGGNDTIKMHGKPQQPQQPQSNTPTTPTQQTFKRVETNTSKELDKLGVDYNEVKERADDLTDAEIIAKVAGGDKTKIGACSSAALAYIGQKNGWDVLDFRGGESNEYFASILSKWRMWGDLGIHEIIENSAKTEIENGEKLFDRFDEGKEYYMYAGGHVAIARKVNGVSQYLELQYDKQRENGWKSITDFNNTLKTRFGCDDSPRYYTAACAIDISELTGNAFRTILGYINTEKSKQMKGVGGNAR